MPKDKLKVDVSVRVSDELIKKVKEAEDDMALLGELLKDGYCLRHTNVAGEYILAKQYFVQSPLYEVKGNTLKELLTRYKKRKRMIDTTRRKNLKAARERSKNND